MMLGVGSGLAALAVVGAVASLNCTPIHSANATTSVLTATSGTLSGQVSGSWSVTKFSWDSAKTNSSGGTGIYKTASSGTNSLQFYNSTNPFVSTATSITLSLKCYADTSTELDYSGVAYLLDSTGATIAASEVSYGPWALKKSWVTNTISFVSSVSSAYGVEFDMAKPTKNFWFDSATVTYTTSDTSSETAAGLSAWINNQGAGDKTGTSSNCLKNYQFAKTAVLAFSATELDAFENGTDATIVTARTRYVNWCTANGDASPWSGAIVGGSASLIKSNTTDNGTIVYVVLGAIAAAAFGGYFFLRKKKENA